MVFLHIERPDCPFVVVAQAPDFLFHKGSNLSLEKVFSVPGTPYHMIAYFVGCMPGSLCFHTMIIAEYGIPYQEARTGLLNPHLKAVGMQWPYPQL
jgi:hypothetical protein